MLSPPGPQRGDSDNPLLGPPNMYSDSLAPWMVVVDDSQQGGSGGGSASVRRPPTAVTRKSQAHMRSWLQLEQDAESGTMIQADKYRLTHKLGVQGRDLRIMDSLASGCPAAILCRDKALVVSLEHIKVIITTNSVLVMNPEDEDVLPFITELKMKLIMSSQANPNGPGSAAGGSFSSARNDSMMTTSAAAAAVAVMPTHSAAKLEHLAELEMPFELRALEVCLDSVSLPVYFLHHATTKAAYIIHAAQQVMGIADKFGEAPEGFAMLGAVCGSRQPRVCGTH